MVPAPHESVQRNRYHLHWHPHAHPPHVTHSPRTLLAGGSDLVLGEDEVVDKVIIFKLIAITLAFFALVMMYQYFATRPPRSITTRYIFPRKKPTKPVSKGTSDASASTASPAARIIEKLKPLICVRRLQQHEDDIEEDEKRLIPDPLKIPLRKKPRWRDRVSFLQKRQGIVFPPSQTSSSAWDSSHPSKPHLKPLKLTLHTARHSVAEKCRRLTGSRSPDAYWKIAETAKGNGQKRYSRPRKHVQDDDGDVDEQLWDKRERDSFFGSDSSTMDEKGELRVVVPVSVPASPPQAHLPARVRFATPLIDDEGAPESLVHSTIASMEPQTPTTPTSPYTHTNDEDLVGAWGPPPKAPRGTYSRGGVVRGSTRPSSVDIVDDEEGFRPRWGVKYLRPGLPARMGGRDAPPSAFEIGDDESDVEGSSPHRTFGGKLTQW